MLYISTCRFPYISNSIHGTHLNLSRRGELLLTWKRFCPSRKLHTTATGSGSGGIPTISQTIFSQPTSFSNEVLPTTFSLPADADSSQPRLVQTSKRKMKSKKHWFLKWKSELVTCLSLLYFSTCRKSPRPKLCFYSEINLPSSRGQPSLFFFRNHEWTNLGLYPDSPWLT